MGCDDVILLVEAGQDVRQGEAFYDRRRKGLGNYFLQCILSDLESLKIHAGVHLKVSENLHRMRSKRFPYAIYYRVKNQVAYVLAVLPMRRRPAWIIKTIRSRS